MFDKKKVSIDFSQHSYNLLTEHARTTKKSNSAIINDLCQAILPLSDNILKKFGKFCDENLTEAIEEHQSKTGFEALETAKELAQWIALSKFFPYEEENTRKMKRFRLKEGYCIVPQDYIVLDNIFGPPEECMYAGVVESRNSEKYGIPHFLFFCNTKYANYYTDEMEATIYAACAKKFPDFNKYYDMQKDLPLKEAQDQEKVKEWMSLPFFGLFHIVEKGDPLYWNPVTPDYIPPDGAMIIRPTTEK